MVVIIVVYLYIYIYLYYIKIIMFKFVKNNIYLFEFLNLFFLNIKNILKYLYIL